MWAAARLDARRVLILVPTLGIIPQTVRLWRRNGPWPEATFLAVCGDSARGLELETTSDAGRVQSFLAASSPVGPSVVVATYQSSSVLVSAGERFDLVIADEAHHLAGGRTKPFAAVVRGEIPPRGSCS